MTPSENRTLSVGTLVTHLLYGRDWLGVILEVREDQKSPSNGAQILVHMVPGTTYCSHFKKGYVVRAESQMTGWISEKWLRVAE